jgi:3-isopropylmalate/(R)-2-methylmalate dehydratase small subunit
VVERLWSDVEADPATEITVDLVEREIRWADERVPFDIDDYTRWRLMDGLDDIGLTLRHVADIDAYEARRPAFLPTTTPA